MVVCDNVEVPWERVFVHNDVGLSRAIYFETPAHCFGNHQSNVRFHAKLRLLVGLASKLTQASGADGIPSVMETLGRLAFAGGTARRRDRRADQHGRGLANRIHDLQ